MMILENRKMMTWHTVNEANVNEPDDDDDDDDDNINTSSQKFDERPHRKGRIFNGGRDNIMCATAQSTCIYWLFTVGPNSST